MTPPESTPSGRFSPGRIAWLSGPLLAASAIATMVGLIPASGPRVQVRWRDSVDADQRPSLERRLHLVNPTLSPGDKLGVRAQRQFTSERLDACESADD